MCQGAGPPGTVDSLHPISLRLQICIVTRINGATTIMLRRTLSGISLSFFLLLLVGCNSGGGNGLAVLDLDRVAAAIGRDKEIAQQIREFAQAQEGKLKQLQSELQQQVSSANEKLARLERAQGD